MFFYIIVFVKLYLLYLVINTDDLSIYWLSLAL